MYCEPVHPRNNVATPWFTGYLPSTCVEWVSDLYKYWRNYGSVESDLQGDMRGGVLTGTSKGCKHLTQATGN